MVDRLRDQIIKSSVSTRSLFQIRLRSLISMPSIFVHGVDLGLALGQRPLGAEHGAIGLHRALHLQPDFRRRIVALRMAEMVEPLQRKVRAVLQQLLLQRIGLEDLTEAQARRTAEHDQVDEAVRSEAVGAMDRDARRFADREQSGTTASGLPSFSVTTSPWKLVGMPPMFVVDGRDDRQRLAGQVDAGEDLPGLR